MCYKIAFYIISDSAIPIYYITDIIHSIIIELITGLLKNAFQIDACCNL